MIADLTTDFTPGVSNVKDATIALTGVNPVTGEKVGLVERVMVGIFAIPGLGNLLKYLSKGGRLLAKAVAILGKALDRLVQRMPRPLRSLWGKLAGHQGDPSDEIPDVFPGPGVASHGSGRTGDGAGRPKDPSPAAEGTRKHSEHAKAARKEPMYGGWKKFSIEKNLKLPNGKVIRPDAVYIHHENKLIYIEDLFTGPAEPIRHQRKTWLAAQSIEIRELVDQGFDVRVTTAMWHPEHMQ